MGTDNKICGFVKAVNKNGILLQTKEDIEGKWWNAIESIEKQITPNLKNNEVEIQVLNIDTRQFSSLKIISPMSLGEKNTISETSMKFRAMAIAYSKDLVVADKITEAEMLEVADGIFYYIKTGERKG